MYADWMKKISLDVSDEDLEEVKLPIERAIEIVKKIKRPSLSGGFEKQSEILKALEIVTNYIETMHSEFDRLEGIEDNTAMLKMELEEQTEANKELNKVIITYKAMINEMADTLKWSLNNGPGFIPSTICTCEGDIKKCKDKICEECIKEYFYKKVR